jgi:hypothetical protein
MTRRLPFAALLLLLGCGRCGGEPVPPPPRLDCGPADLVLHTDVRARAGEDVALTATERLYLGVVVANPCDAVVELVTDSLCLVHQFELTDPDGSTRRGGPACARESKQWAIPPGGAETATFELGTLPAGGYEVTVPFTFTDRTAEAGFEVLE